jgi:hypothetical protein
MSKSMNAIIYRCPETRLCVDHWFEPADNGETFESVHCRACNHVHLVNVTTGRVLVVQQETVARNSIWAPR